MTIQSIIDQIGDEISELEVKLYHHPYSASEDDYTIENGEKVWTEEYLKDMPSDYATMLGRFGTLQEVKDLLVQSEAKEILDNDLENFLMSNHPRFKVLSDE